MPGTWQRALPRGRSARSQIEGFAILTLLFREEASDLWTGECRELGTATDGTTLRQVHSELVDLVVLHLNALEETGDRERFFETHRIRFYRADATPSVVQMRLPLDENAFVHPHKIPLSKAA